jgi:hypothetical protein
MIENSRKAFRWARYLPSAVCASLLVGSVAMAAPITFTDLHNVAGDGFTLDSSHTSYSFTHNIVNPSGDPQGDVYSALTDTLSTATLTLNFRDDECDGGFLCFFPRTENISLALDGTNLPSFEVDTGDVSFAVNLALLAADGILNVNVNWISGDIRFDESTLVASGNRSTAPTPIAEPGSLVLLGSGIVALGIVGRKRLKR